MSPDDRDRGLRVAGTLTGAVAAITLVAVGGTTALAASQTRDQDAAKKVAATAPTEQAQSATPTVQPTGKPKHRKTAGPVKKKKKKVKVTTAAGTTGTSAGAGGSTSVPSSTAATSPGKTTPATTTPKATTKTSTTKPKPSTTTATTTTSTTTSAPATTTTPPAVPTSAS